MEEAIVTKEVTEAETASESPIKDNPDAIVQKQLFATEEVTEAETAPESPIKEEPEAVVEEAIVTKDDTEIETAQSHQSKKNLMLLWKKQL